MLDIDGSSKIDIIDRIANKLFTYTTSEKVDVEQEYGRALLVRRYSNCRLITNIFNAVGYPKQDPADEDYDVIQLEMIVNEFGSEDFYIMFNDNADSKRFKLEYDIELTSSYVPIDE